MYIKSVELTHFKSFGGTTQVPLLPGFTVISGPNGSGKSNILDALLFALGLSSSKGMRAERLPDLVNQTQTSRGRSTVEASVTVTFDLGDRYEAIDEDREKSSDAAGDNGSHNGIQSSPEDGDGGTEAVPDRPSAALRSEWTVTRKLRVTQQGTYTSNYYINEQSCTLTDLHEQLHRLRIYPEGYNVVLQGDVTSII
ncbi:MAG TPA: AAA family ATPase, partial [Coleofasciculaceae cyanobacterium]